MPKKYHFPGAVEISSFLQVPDALADTPNQAYQGMQGYARPNNNNNNNRHYDESESYK